MRTEGSTQGNAGNVLVVAKERIAENGEYNLTGERYRVVERRGKQKWEMVRIGDICDLYNGKAFKPSDWEKKEDGGLPIIRIQNLNNENAEFNYYSGNIDDQVIINDGDLLFSWSGSRGTSFGPHIWKGQKAILNQHIFKVEYKDIVQKNFLYHMLKFAVKEVEENLHGGVGLVHITKGNFEKIKLPVPPLDIQWEIVAEIEGYQKIIDGTRQVVDNWKPQIEVDPEWPMVKLGDVITLQRGYDLPKQEWEKGEYPIVGSNGIIGYHNAYKEIGPGVVTGRSGTIGKVHYISEKYYWPHNTSLFVKDFKGNNRKFISYLLQSVDLKSLGETTSAVPSLDRKNAHRLMVQLPPLKVQKKIVDKMEADQKWVDGCRELMIGYKGKVKRVVDGVWGE
ncbi:hypothetical protein AGMMS50268_36060 [Spirochaetia bacterium]|nr:hypothetical protein AGMMS50268_36060 [Spirochaetia bacterium]